jgi:hypothetical protein
MTKIQPVERCTARDALERILKLCESLSDELLASSVPSKVEYLSDEEVKRLRDSAFDQFRKGGKECAALS